MRRIRRIAICSIVWLTAAATLLAGVPHVVCRCSPAPIPSEPTPPAGANTCCCGGATPSPCCTQHSGSETTTCCAKPAIAEETSGDDESGPTVGQTTCKRQLEQTSGPALALPAKPVADHVPAVHLAHFDAVLAPETPTPAFSSIWDLNHLPPPTDRVTLFERLTI